MVVRAWLAKWAALKGSLMKRLIIATLATASLAAIPPTTASAATMLKGHEYSAQAKYSLIKARAIALKARPGKITDQELEKEAGGSGLRYSFDIMSGGKTIEVGVDAKTGKVLENGVESTAKEAKEEKAEPMAVKH